MVVGLSKYRDIERKARAGRLTSRDFVFLRLNYNDHKTCVFTMLKDTPHCEVTSQGKGRGPVFFVTEPNDFKMSNVELCGYQLKLGK